MSVYDSILAQYENLQNNSSANKPKLSNEERMKKYFTTFIPDGVSMAQKVIRILPVAEGQEVFTKVKGHSIQVDGKWQKFICPEFANNEPCPFCEARQALFEKGDEASVNLAKQYRQKDMFVLKLIERGKEDEGVKFWRFNRDLTNKGVMDKIIDVIRMLGPTEDITSVDNGIDLIVNVTRDQHGRPVVSSIAAARTNSVLTDNAEIKEMLLSNTETWRDVYKVYSYDYLALIVNGETPMYDKVTKGYVSKSVLEAREAAKTSIGDAAIQDIMEQGKLPTVTDEAVIDASTFTDAEEGDDIPF